MAAPDSFLLTAIQATFMQGAVSMNVATRNADNLPTVMRAYGCALAADLRSVRVFVYPVHNENLLRHLQYHRVIAAVFSRPSTHESIQLKGDDAAISPATSADLAVMERYLLIMSEELRAIGFPATFTDAMLPPATNDAVAICFTPLHAFAQTPGPQAGRKLPT